MGRPPRLPSDSIGEASRASRGSSGDAAPSPTHDSIGEASRASRGSSGDAAPSPTHDSIGEASRASRGSSGDAAPSPMNQWIAECVHCGFCLPACPTYQSWGEEMNSPRGRIYLMKGLEEGSLAPSEEVVANFDACLGCMGCVSACPSGVRYDALIEHTRADLEAKTRRSLGDRWFRALVFALFPHPRRLEMLRVVLWLYVASGLQTLLRRLGLFRLLPARLRQLDALMPPLHARAPASPRAPATEPVRRRVALVSGCVQRVFFPNVNDATVRVLAAEGCEVVVPPDQGCCGALSLHAGRRQEARRLAGALLDRFDLEKIDAIVVNAAGCGSTLKEYGRLFAGDEARAERAAAFAAKVRDVNELLVELGPRAVRHPLALRVAYHDACHLAHAQRIVSQPRALLRDIPALELCEIAEGDQCCGSAGVYNLLEPESAKEIGERKLDHILATGAALFASANPGCTLQLQSLARLRQRTLRAAHPIEILDASIRDRPLKGE